jgi:hypothetical protein
MTKGQETANQIRQAIKLLDQAATQYEHGLPSLGLIRLGTATAKLACVQFPDGVGLSSVEPPAGDYEPRRSQR